MNTEVLSVILLPFLGTTIGAGFVFFLKGKKQFLKKPSILCSGEARK